MDTKIYACSNHGNDKAYFYCQSKKLFLCKNCIVDKKYTNEDNVVLEELVSRIGNYEQIIEPSAHDILEIANKEAEINAILVQDLLKEIGAVLNETFSTDSLLSNLIKWSEGAYIELQRVKDWREGKGDFDTTANSLKDCVVQLDSIRKSYREETIKSIGSIRTKLLDELKKIKINSEEFKNMEESKQKISMFKSIKQSMNKSENQSLNLSQGLNRSLNQNANHIIQAGSQSKLMTQIKISNHEDISNFPNVNNNILKIILENMKDEDIAMLPFNRLEHVKELSLEFNNSPEITNKTISALNPLQTWKNLNSLSLNFENTKLDDEGFFELIQVILGLKNLKECQVKTKNSKVSPDTTKLLQADFPSKLKILLS